jgi:hypothetical protein
MQSTATRATRDAAHAFELASSSRSAAHRSQVLEPEFGIAEQEERLWEGPAPLARRPVGSVLNLPFQSWLLPLKQRVSE